MLKSVDCKISSYLPALELKVAKSLVGSSSHGGVIECGSKSNVITAIGEVECLKALIVNSPVIFQLLELKVA